MVEGPIAAGKTEFAKKLADDLDMYYMPQATMDDIYINDYGYDLRDLDEQLPPGARSFDEKKFVNDPANRLTAPFQLNMYSLKLVSPIKLQICYIFHKYLMKLKNGPNLINCNILPS